MSSNIAASATSPSPPLPYASSPSSNFSQNPSNNIGYIIAISLGFLVLLSTFLLAFYVCLRRKTSTHLHSNTPATSSNNNELEGGIVLPRVIFVAEGDEDEELAQEHSPGIDPAAISSYSNFPFSKSKASAEDTVCSICLCEYTEGEMLRLMRDCRHYFHLTCVDARLHLNASCPVCRTSPMPTPLSTPLSEVVPSLSVLRRPEEEVTHM